MADTVTRLADRDLRQRVIGAKHADEGMSLAILTAMSARLDRLERVVLALVSPAAMTPERAAILALQDEIRALREDMEGK